MVFPSFWSIFSSVGRPLHAESVWRQLLDFWALIAFKHSLSVHPSGADLYSDPGSLSICCLFGTAYTVSFAPRRGKDFALHSPFDQPAAAFAPRRTFFILRCSLPVLGLFSLPGIRALRRTSPVLHFRLPTCMRHGSGHPAAKRPLSEGVSKSARRRRLRQAHKYEPLRLASTAVLAAEEAERHRLALALAAEAEGARLASLERDLSAQRDRALLREAVADAERARLEARFQQGVESRLELEAAAPSSRTAEADAGVSTAVALARRSAAPLPPWAVDL